MGTAVKRAVPDRVKPRSFVIFDIRTLSTLITERRECPDVKNYK